MKSLLLVALALGMVGCSSIKTHDAQCQVTTEDAIKAFVSAAMQNGMNITMQDVKTGFAAAETAPSQTLNYFQKYVWQVNVTPSPTSASVNIRATAKSVQWTANAFGAQTGMSETYPDDDFNKGSGNDWYWNMREALERSCGATFTVNKKK